LRHPESDFALIDTPSNQLRLSVEQLEESADLFLDPVDTPSIANTEATVEALPATGGGHPRAS
jgi:hypothetical protein